MPIYNVNTHKPFFTGERDGAGEKDGFEKTALPDVRVYCSYCHKPMRIEDDDLDSVYSRSDYCQCQREGFA